MIWVSRKKKLDKCQDEAIFLGIIQIFFLFKAFLWIYNSRASLPCALPPFLFVLEVRNCRGGVEFQFHCESWVWWGGRFAQDGVGGVGCADQGSGLPLPGMKFSKSLFQAV